MENFPLLNVKLVAYLETLILLQSAFQYVYTISNVTEYLLALFQFFFWFDETLVFEYTGLTVKYCEPCFSEVVWPPILVAIEILDCQLNWGEDLLLRVVPTC